MARAAGGTSQRLKPAFATILSRLRIPPLAATAPSMLAVVFIVIAPETCDVRVNIPPRRRLPAKLFRKNDTQKTFQRPRLRIAPNATSGLTKAAVHIDRHVHSHCSCVELSGECPIIRVARLSGHAARSRPLFRGCDGCYCPGQRRRDGPTGAIEQCRPND
jgi:hypothetical protein